MANAIVGALRINLGIDSALFSKGLSDADRRLAKFGLSTKKILAGVAASVTATMAGVSLAVRGVIQDADAMSKAAQKIGIPIEELTRLRYAADLSGVSFEGLSNSVKKLSQNMVDISNGSVGPAYEAFKLLDIGIKNADGSFRTSTDILEQVADVFSAMPDGVDKTAAAVAIFGRAGMDMIPMLNGGAEAIRELTGEADRLGLTIDEATGKRAEAFNDNLARLKTSFKGIAVQLTSALLPALSQFSEWVADAARAFADLPTGMKTAIATIGALTAVLVPLLAVIGLAGGGMAALGAAFSAAGGIFAGVASGALAALGVAFGALVSPIGLVVMGVAAASAAFLALTPQGNALARTIGERVKGAITSVMAVMPKSIDDIKAFGHHLTAFFRQLPNLVLGATVGLLNSGLKFVNNFVNAVIAQLNVLIDKINALGGNFQKIGEVKLHIDNRWAREAKSALKESWEIYRAALETNATARRQAKEREIPKAEQTGGGFQDTKTSNKKGKTQLELDQEAINAATKLSVKSAQQAWGETIAKNPWPGPKIDFELPLTRAEEAAREMGDSISGAFDRAAFQGGKLSNVLKGLAQDLLRITFRRSVTEPLGNILSNSIGSIVGKLPGFANGGSFQVGGVGGIDSQLVAFRASPNETVTVARPDQTGSSSGMVPSGRALNITVQTTINSNGSGSSELEQIKAAIAERDRALPSRVVAAVNEGILRGDVEVSNGR